MAGRKKKVERSICNDRDVSLEEAETIIEREGLSTAEFYWWLEGQTCPMLAGGKLGVFMYDLKRWVEFKKGGAIPDWD